MRRPAVEALRMQLLEVLDTYREHEDNIEAREKAQALVEEYADDIPALDDATEDALRVVEEIAMEQAMTVSQQRVIDATEALQDAMHEEVI